MQSQPVRLISDTLIGHATPRGYEAIRDRFTGSWFIQHIVNVFMNHACELEIHDLFKMIPQIFITIK
ncbi:hypothetical protein B566_EDAN012282 [Ephemera danica]|nr:hypothetical protein B566_EDAN012282 [Ephemera danica]